MNALRCYVTRFIQQSHWKKINRKEKIKMNLKLPVVLEKELIRLNKIFYYFSVSNSKTRIMVQSQPSKLCLCPRTLLHWKIVVLLPKTVVHPPVVKHFWPQNQPQQLALTTTIVKEASTAATTKLIIQRRR